MEGYYAGLWKGVAVVEDRLKIGGEEVSELIYSDRSIEGDIDENFEGVVSVV